MSGVTAERLLLGRVSVVRVSDEELRLLAGGVELHGLPRDATAGRCSDP
jgi:hypothetical protein